MSTKDYARRPELKTNETSFVEFIKRPTFEALNRIAERAHSEFKKPYREDFWPMELWGDYPWPQYHPFLPSPDFPGPMPEEPWGPGSPYFWKVCLPLCYFSNPREILPGESEWIKFIGFCPSIFKVTATLVGAGKDEFSIGEVRHFPDENRNSVWGALVTANAGADGTAYVQFKIRRYGFFMAPDGVYEDPNDIIEEIIKCKVTADCCPSGDFAFDSDTTADTIEREDSITIYVTGGCPPYSWSVAGTGFTLDNATTTGLTNTLNADDEACGTATITVTDHCDDSVEGAVRCTVGVWSSLGNICELEGEGEETEVGSGGGCNNRWNYELIVGGIKQTQQTCISCDCGEPHTCPMPENYNCPYVTCPACNAVDCTGGYSNCIDGTHESALAIGYECEESAGPWCTCYCYCVKGLEAFEWICEE